MDKLVESTKALHGRRYLSHKFCYDVEQNSIIEYDPEREVKWRDYGETEHITHPKYLTDLLHQISGQPSWFRYFLDGSRHTYKVDDMAFKNDVYPILAGQVGISCCRRDDRKMAQEFFNRSLVVVVPNKALKSEFDKRTEAQKLCQKINESERLTKLGLKIDNVLSYDLSTDEKYDKKGISKIQDYMVEQEKDAVIKLVKQQKLKQKSYLIKDGSLEYKAVKEQKWNLSEAKMRLNYEYVIGVSKSFDPTKCFVKGGKTNSSIIAELRQNERTPACCYDSEISGAGVSFCVWYLRLRNSFYTQNVFDGIIKVEKIIQDSEKATGVDSQLIDLISAHLLRERNPVCYGRDSRWANHLYPIYVAEQYAKAKYMSNNLFLSLF